MNKAWFTSDFEAFFQELAANNHKEWFDTHRKRYQETVKVPFERLVKHLIEQIRDSHEPDLLIGPSEAIFRINRDIRFAKDKRPYKEQVSALISPKGKKNATYASLYFELSPRGVQVYGGCYQPEKEDLRKIRQHLIHHREEFEQLINAAAFQKTFGTIQGDAVKRMPADLEGADPQWPMVYRTQFFYTAAFPATVIAEPGLEEHILEAYRAQYDLMQFLREPFDS
jgi:uncharacterized protein (TIGR02453 family)